MACRTSKYWVAHSKPNNRKIAIVLLVVSVLVLAVTAAIVIGVLYLRSPSSDGQTPGVKALDGERDTSQVHGNWSSWFNWTTCSKTCGSGTKFRLRTCNNPSPTAGGNNCSGNNNQTELCSIQKCLVHGNWSSWSNWTTCSKYCGSGTISRVRACNNPSPAAGGNNCSGDSNQTELCNDQNCPVHGNWSSWSKWTTCSKTCGSGTKFRLRTCDNPSPTAGGNNCSGNNNQTELCSIQTCPVHGNWSSWSNWTTCTKSCGSGLRSRVRTCNNPSPDAGGNNCSGDSIQTELCNVQNCPVSFWSRWSTWSQCSHSCAGGNKTRSRSCVKENREVPLRNCAGKPLETKACSEWQCPDCNRTCSYGKINKRDGCDTCLCDSHVLTGRVTTLSGQPLSNASISLAQSPYKILVQTNVSGYFSAPGVCAESQLIVVQRSGFVTLRQNSTVSNVTFSNINAKLAIAVPPRITLHPQKKLRFSGQDASFCCSGEGNPAPRIEWFKGPDILEVDTSDYNNTLNLRNVSSSGIYSCRAINEFGAEFSDAALLQILQPVGDTCISTPKFKNQTLPPGCLANETSLNYFDAGECENVPCLRNDTDINTGCTDTKLCCSIKKWINVTVLCNGFVIHLQKITKCGCSSCRQTDGVSNVIKGVVVGGWKELPLAYGKIVVGADVYQTDSKGRFSFPLPDGVKRVSVVFEDLFEKFEDSIKVFEVMDGQTAFYKVNMLQKANYIGFNASESCNTSLGESPDHSAFGELEIAPNSFLSENGDVYTEQAKISVSVVDPRNETSMRSAPGDFTAVSEEGEQQMMVSTGMLKLNIRDKNNKKLSLAKPIQLFIDPQQLNIKTDGGNSSLPNLWWLDSKAGRWRLAGNLKMEEPNSKRKRRSGRKFLTTEITDAIFDASLNLDYLNRNCFVRVETQDSGSQISMIGKDEYGSYYGYTQAQTGSNKIACVQTWCGRKAFLQADYRGESLQPVSLNELPSNLNAGIISSYEDEKSLVRSFEFKAIPATSDDSTGPINRYRGASALSPPGIGLEICKKDKPEYIRFKFIRSETDIFSFNSIRDTNRLSPLYWKPYLSDNCYVKVKVTGIKVVVIAESYRSDMTTRYGFSGSRTGSVGEDESIACLEVRCSGPNFDPVNTMTMEETYVVVTPVTGQCQYTSLDGTIAGFQSDCSYNSPIPTPKAQEKGFCTRYLSGDLGFFKEQERCEEKDTKYTISYNCS